MNDINEFIDLPILKEIELGYAAFGESLLTIMESTLILMKCNNE